ncbi:MAG: hypothetical protein ACI85O_001807 [Saprospiraceae bacterium]
MTVIIHFSETKGAKSVKSETLFDDEGGVLVLFSFFTRSVALKNVYRLAFFDTFFGKQKSMARNESLSFETVQN